MLTELLLVVTLEDELVLELEELIATLDALVVTVELFTVLPPDEPPPPPPHADKVKTHITKNKGSVSFNGKFFIKSPESSKCFLKSVLIPLSLK